MHRAEGIKSSSPSYAPAELRRTRPPKLRRSVGGSDHAQRMLVRVEQRLLLGSVGGIHRAQRNDLPHGLDIVAHALCLAVDVADVAADRLALLLELLDALHEALQPVGRDRPSLGLLRNG